LSSPKYISLLVILLIHLREPHQRRYTEKNGFGTATKLGATNKFFVAATKNFAAATKRFVDSTKHFVDVTKCFCYPYVHK